jgi:acetyl esterase
MKPITKAFCAVLMMILSAGILRAQANSFTITVDQPIHGRLQLTPPLPADGKYPAGTVVTVTTTPDPGYAQDSAFYAVPGRFGQMYHEGMTPDSKSQSIRTNESARPSSRNRR